MKYKAYRYTLSGEEPMRGLRAFMPDFQPHELREFLDHQLSQCEAAEEEGDDDPRWKSLHYCANKARGAVKVGDSAAIVMAFYALGKAVEAFDHPDKREYLEQIQTLYRKQLADEKRKFPTYRKQAAIEACRNIAARIWASDYTQEIRLADMCERIYKMMLDQGAGEYLPGESQGLKQWIRPVAPDYARRPGRPKKNPKTVR